MRCGIALGDDRGQLVELEEVVVGAACLGQVGLAAELESLDPIAAAVGEDEQALAVDGRDAEVARHRLCAATAVDDDPHIDVVRAHRLGQDEVELVLADRAIDLPAGTGAVDRGGASIGP